ncbi:hypothetical protein C8N32_1433 [Rhodovulum imhoffii]|uniref:Uncharacterized protein n=1 Tax=Rhodovulum imhoffii TaxID=365340 RepID=A0A2T5BL24_9RHOB|nr:hypothetical protein C8N32_1433 [Rhodovulum imhoffii]
MGRSSTAKKAAPRDTATKLAQQRLSVLELARELGNVAEACRQRDMDRNRLVCPLCRHLKDSDNVHFR